MYYLYMIISTEHFNRDIVKVSHFSNICDYSQKKKKKNRKKKSKFPKINQTYNTQIDIILKFNVYFNIHRVYAKTTTLTLM